MKCDILHVHYPVNTESNITQISNCWMDREQYSGKRQRGREVESRER